MEFWQIRNRAFVAGESVAEASIARLEAVVSGRIVSKAKDSAKAQQELNDFYRRAVTVEHELTPQQTEAKRERHNRALFEKLTNGRRET